MAATPQQQAEMARLRAKAKMGWCLYFDTLREGAARQSALCLQVQDLTRQVEALQGAAPAAATDDFERPLNQLRALLKSTRQSLECPVCLDELRPAITNKAHEGYMVIFGCGHSVCNGCAHALHGSGAGDCPACRRDVRSALDHLAPVDPAAEENEVTPGDVGLEEAPPGDAVPSRFPGKCKACFEEVKREALIVPSSQARRVYVHLKCRDAPLQDCHHCGKKFGGEDRVLGKYADRILACNDCGLRHRWTGAKRPAPPAPPSKKAGKRARPA